MQRHNNDNQMSTGRLWVNICGRIIAHLTIVLACVLAVIYFADLYNRGEMSLLNNSATKGMLLTLCLLSGVGAVLHLSSLRRLRVLKKYFDLLARSKK